MSGGAGGDDALGAVKARLRSSLRERLQAISAEEARAAAAAVERRVLALPEVGSASALLVTLSFGTELPTRDLIARLLDRGLEVYVPRVERASGLLHVHAYPCALERLAFGLEQPAPGTPELEPAAIDSTLDVVLLGGLGFDRAGYRLGYGRGYFDRFLKARRLFAVGLGYHAQLVERLPVERHDVRLSALVTELETLRFAPANAVAGTA